MQGTAEGAAFPREQLDHLLDLANIGNAQLFAAQQAALAQVLPAEALAALVASPDGWCRSARCFPQTEIGADPAGVRAYAEALKPIGYRHTDDLRPRRWAPIRRFDPGWSGYTNDSLFHEPFVVFGYLAALVPDLELVTAVIILPQRQTVLVAKQAAELDI